MFKLYRKFFLYILEIYWSIYANWYSIVCPPEITNFLGTLKNMEKGLSNFS